MKRMYFIIASAAVLLCGCHGVEKDPAGADGKDGSFQYGNVYILVDGGNLVDAQNHRIDFPEEGGTTGIYVVSMSDETGGMSEYEWLAIQNDGLPSEFVPSAASGLSKNGWFIQRLLLTVSPNTTGKDREGKMKVLCTMLYSGHMADLMIRQESD